MNNLTLRLLFEDRLHRVGAHEGRLATDEREHSSRCSSPMGEDVQIALYAMDGMANMSWQIMTSHPTNNSYQTL